MHPMPIKIDPLNAVRANNFEICRYEEYIDYLFPEETQTTNLKILEAAYKWKKQKTVSDED